MRELTIRNKKKTVITNSKSDTIRKDKFLIFNKFKEIHNDID